MADKTNQHTDDELLIAQRAFKTLRERERTLSRTIEALQAVQFLDGIKSPVERESDRFDFARRRIAEIFPDGPPRLRHVPKLIEQAQNEREELGPSIDAARDEYHMAKQSAAARIGAEMQPRHAKAVHAVAAALENLSREIAKAAAINTEFAARSPEPTSPLLPDVASDLEDCRLDVWDSAAARWARRMRQIKALP